MRFPSRKHGEKMKNWLSVEERRRSNDIRSTMNWKLKDRNKKRNVNNFIAEVLRRVFVRSYDKFCMIASQMLTLQSCKFLHTGLGPDLLYEILRKIKHV